MSKSIFISYRVQDTSGETGRLVDTLKRYYKSDQLFIDIEKIEPGLDFTQVINKYLEKCEVVLMVIGPDWIGKDKLGNPRIVKDDDWVRIEISTALKRNVRIIPILVDGANLPDITQLPEDIKYITRLQTHELSNKRWDYDTKKLVSHLSNIGIEPELVKQINKPPKNSSNNSLLKIGIGVFIGIFLIVLLALIAAGIDQEQYPEPDPTPEPIALMESTNISGIWKEANNDYPATFEIFQSGQDLTMSIYNLYGNMVGEGKGTIEGNKIRIHIEEYISGTKQIITTTLTNNKTKMLGTITVTNDGINQPYTYELSKCDACNESN